jgi:predicted DNA-binding transcriptional regulator AlpA
MSDAVVSSRSVPRLGLNRAEVALSIGVSPNTVDLMVEEGYLPKPRKWHSRKLWLVAEIEAAMSEWPEDGILKQREDANDGDDWRAA